MRKKIGFYDYTVVLTYLGFFIALFGIMRTMDGKYWDAMVCLMLSGVCDMFDGAVAATKRNRTTEEKRFGIQIDSLSDLVSFGIFPALFVYQLSNHHPLIGVISMGYALCALIRLAYYNVLEEARQKRLEEKEQRMGVGGSLEERVEKEENKVYLGLPVTVIAITLPALFFFYDGSMLHRPLWFGTLLFGMAVAFVTPFEIQKPKAMGKIVLILLGALEAFGMAYLAFVGAM